MLITRFVIGLALQDAMPAVHDSPQTASTEPSTRVALPNGRMLVIQGRWTRRETMWEDAALLFGRELVDAGARETRTIYDPNRHDELELHPAFSQDLTSCAVVLDKKNGIAIVDVKSGIARSLLRLPTHLYTWDASHMEPAPVGPPQQATASGLWVVALQEETNDEIARWQQEEWRTGGHWFLALLPGTDLSRFVCLSGPSAIPGRLGDWVAAPKAEKIYAIIDPREPRRCVLQELDLRGRSTGRFDFELRCVHALDLSRDECWLLLERRNHDEWWPAHEFTSSPAWAELQELVARAKSGFALLDLESGAVLEGPSRGHSARFSPNNRRIAFLDEWDLCLFDADSRETIHLARREDPPRSDGPSYWGEPVWSFDGRRVAWSPPALMKEGSRKELYTVAFDFSTREVLVLSAYDPSSWSPVPHPFGAGIRLDKKYASERWQHPSKR